MSVSRPEAIASQPSRCGRVASANVSWNQRRMNGRKSAIQIKFYASAEAHLTQQQSAQRAPGILELRGLTVILGSLEPADGEQERPRARRRAVHRAVASRRLRRELQDLVEIREADRLEIIETADAASGLDDVGGQAGE